jgi:hypothetical protein
VDIAEVGVGRWVTPECEEEKKPPTSFTTRIFVSGINKDLRNGVRSCIEDAIACFKLLVVL